MTSLATSLYLDSSGQAQLAKLKQANQIPLNRVDSKITSLRGKQPTLNTVKTEVEELKTALQKVRDAPEAERGAALAKFVSEFNDVQKQLTSTTGKDGPLRSFSSLRDARAGLRTPLSDINVLTELKAVGIATTREGLTYKTGTEAAALSTTTLEKLESTVSFIETRMGRAESQVQTQLDRLNSEKSRIQVSVDRANARTETSFIKYYQLIQQMNQSMSNSSMGM